MGKVKNLAGKTYGLLTVVALVKVENGRSYWLCKCECGNTKVIRGTNLQRGCAKSCGCARHPVKHGMYGTTEHNIWSSLIQRCTNPNSQFYHNYGGRGIRVCARWRTSFEAFLEDMGPRPSKKHSIDRFPNNDGNYEPGNCRWATRKEQQRNKRTSRILRYKGLELPAVVMAEHCGVNYKRLMDRLYMGWSVEDAIERPVVEHCRR